jgi:hypothetical protein
MGKVGLGLDGNTREVESEDREQYGVETVENISDTRPRKKLSTKKKYSALGSAGLDLFCLPLATIFPSNHTPRPHPNPPHPPPHAPDWLPLKQQIVAVLQHGAQRAIHSQHRRVVDGGETDE